MSLDKVLSKRHRLISNYPGHGLHLESKCISNLIPIKALEIAVMPLHFTKTYGLRQQLQELECTWNHDHFELSKLWHFKAYDSRFINNWTDGCRRSEVGRS